MVLGVGWLYLLHAFTACGLMVGVCVIVCLGVCSDLLGVVGLITRLVYLRFDWLLLFRCV